MKSYVIGCDNAAVSMKDMLVRFLESQGVTVEDLGCQSEQDDTLYPYIAERVSRRVADSNGEKRGILLCGTGIGMAMSANKVKGIRAAVCHDMFSAQRSILSNDGNVLCMGARVIGPEVAKMIVGYWITLDYKDGPSTPKIQAIEELEERYFA